MQDSNFDCLYCGLNKASNEASLEHAIPQFMGGDDAPQKYKLKNVCRQCNNRLGLFVDASYAKSWFVTNALARAAWRMHTGPSDRALPLSCMGLVEIPGLIVPDSAVAEHWIGPSGETIIWIRTHDDRVGWYSGGNPIDKKQKASTAYLSMTGQDPNRWEIGISSFLETFKEKRIRKILCAEIVEAPPGTIAFGFQAQTEDDEKNVLAIRSAIASQKLRVTALINKNFDLRFISKMALGVGYSFFGEAYLTTQMAIEARKGCWPKQDETSASLGSSTLSSSLDANFAGLAGYPGAVCLVVLMTGGKYFMALTIDQRLPFSIELAPADLTSSHIKNDEGYVLLLFPHLQKFIEITLAEMLSHMTQVNIHPELQEIDKRLEAASLFHSTLDPI